MNNERGGVRREAGARINGLASSGADASPLLGPGSQPPEADDGDFVCLPMPEGMLTYAPPVLPEPGDAAGTAAALALLGEVGAALQDWRRDDRPRVFAVTLPDAAGRRFLDQILGEGEVAAVCDGVGDAGAPETARAQESVFAGVWRVQRFDAAGNLRADCIEVGELPSIVIDEAFKSAAPRVGAEEPFPEGVMNAPPLLAEINGRLSEAERRPQASPYGAAHTHVINLSLLPQTEEDLALLNARLGAGRVRILSRGYGNCRIESTGVDTLWWVKYYNSQDALILNTIEMTPAPLAACAAPEDICDSADRLAEILEAVR